MAQKTDPQKIHILNGDALLHQFPEEIEGKKIIARECLIEGETTADDLDDFWESRAEYLADTYPEHSKEEYFEQVKPEFSHILNISEHDTVFLWFEEDLFCQANMWFVCYLLQKHTSVTQIKYVHPDAPLEFGFGGMNTKSLITAYKQAIPVSEDQLQIFAELWKAFRISDISKMSALRNQSEPPFRFAEKSISARIDQIEHNKPVQILREIITELDTTDFGPVFRVFHKRAAVYGFGDLQIKRMFDEIINESKNGF